jgi:sodium-dependent dicarboxylate transporter 2/3/5
MWLSNTATTMMMFPIAMSVIHVIEVNQQSGHNIRNFSLTLMLSIAYASNFALGTIIGTPPNVAYVNYISDKFNYNIGFTDWMIIFTPLTIVLLIMLYWVLVKWLYPNNIKHSEKGNEFIKEEIGKLGPLSLPEKRVSIVFIITVLLWIFKDLINSFQKRIITLFLLDNKRIGGRQAACQHKKHQKNSPISIHQNYCLAKQTKFHEI